MIINVLNVKEVFSDKLIFFAIFLSIWFCHILLFYLLRVDKKLMVLRDISVNKITVLVVNIFLLVIVSLLFLLAMQNLRAGNS